MSRHLPIAGCWKNQVRRDQAQFAIFSNSANRTAHGRRRRIQPATLDYELTRNPSPPRKLNDQPAVFLNTIWIFKSTFRQKDPQRPVSMIPSPPYFFSIIHGGMRSISADGRTSIRNRYLR